MNPVEDCRRAGAALSDGEQTEAGTLHAIMRALPVGVWVARVPGGELAYANAEFLSIMGMQAREDVAAGEYATAYSILDRSGRLYPEDRLPFVRAMQERTTVVVDDLVIARPDGKRAYVRAFGRPIFDPSGLMTHVAVAFIDISAQVDAERAGDEARGRLAAALHHAPIILFTTDHRGAILVSEGAGLASLGYVPGQLVGQNVFELYREMPDVQENLRRALAGHSFTVSSNIGPTTLESFMGPLYGEDGRVSGMLGISTDVTERLRLQRQVTHADRMAVLGRLAASIAHEINNPLAYVTESIRIATERVARLEHGANEQETLLELRRLLADAAEGSERVRMIARDLKSFAHPDEDTRSIVRIDDAIQTAARLIAKRTETRARVQLELSGEAFVHADENRLVQVFTNLILNAADALSASNPRQNLIRISSSQRGASAVVEIADSGPGVPASMRALVFEPFFTTKPVGEGSGLGLHVTRTLVEALGGTIEVGTANEGGALFTVRIPVSTARAPEPGPAGQEPVAVPARRPQVLIIDDEPMLARVFQATLENECDVDIALGGRQALTLLLAGKPYDFIFCDLMMSDIGGAQLYAELKACAPGLERKLIFMTGGVYDPTVAAFLESVDNRCVDKPFDIRREIFQAGS
jgi:two-component system cell cycle sensor histidine kinase/response regulator CckA